MHKNYNSCLHILDMHLGMGETYQFSHRKQILVLICFFISDMSFVKGTDTINVQRSVQK